MTAGRPSRPPRFVYLLNVAQRRLQAWLAVRQSQAAASGTIPPTPAQGGVLFVLAQQDGATMGQLAHELDLAPSAVSGLMQRMAAQGWIERRPDPDDARTQRAWLCEAGRAQLGPLREAIADINAQLTAGFSETELQTFNVCRGLSL